MRGVEAGAGAGPGSLQPLSRGLAHGNPILTPFFYWPLSRLRFLLPRELPQADCRRVLGTGGLGWVQSPSLCVLGNPPQPLRGWRGEEAQERILWVWGRRAEAKFQPNALLLCKIALPLLWGKEVQAEQRSAGGARGLRMVGRSVAGGQPDQDRLGRAGRG